MREIKFRAWDKNNKQMCEVTHLKFSKCQYLNVGYRRLLDRKMIDDNSLLDEKMNGTCALMQYTGLKDKNDKEIYEGDVVRQYADCDEYGCDIYFRYLIEWDNEQLAYCGNEIQSKGLTNDRYYGTDMADYEIIGNIYENPELLESEV